MIMDNDNVLETSIAKYEYRDIFNDTYRGYEILSIAQH